MPPNLHVWEKFIKPEELLSSLKQHGMQNQDLKGTKPSSNNIIKFIRDLRQYSKGRLSAAQLGERYPVQEGSDIAVTYMGYAIKL